MTARLDPPALAASPEAHAPLLQRPRRLRRTTALRRMVRETHLDPAQLVLPLFVRPGTGVRHPIGSMPGASTSPPD